MSTRHSVLSTAAAAVLVLGLLVLGCATTDSTIVGSYSGTLAFQDWRTIARTNQPRRGEIVRIVDAGRSDALSNHFVIVRSRELPHRHLRHDSTVVILEGEGTMTIGKEKKKVRPGAVIFIPRGRVHSFENDGDNPAVALVVYAPPFDPQDRELVGLGTEPRRRPGPADLRKGGGPEPPGSSGAWDEGASFESTPESTQESTAPDESERLPGHPLSSPGAAAEEEAPPLY
ncbi:MAG: cupin domain-containing protein [Deltaproteobacteria bacterium]|nr:cupin domain-containing protein [Deltaproteobacteria bacterium]